MGLSSFPDTLARALAIVFCSCSSVTSDSGTVEVDINCTATETQPNDEHDCQNIPPMANCNHGDGLGNPVTRRAVPAPSTLKTRRMHLPVA
ncbi:hypothetical protein Mapa_009548 [Marchantia paleacea]|nr:hypothetical protein Mapa_009548 [Marchantia paleacea]